MSGLHVIQLAALGATTAGAIWMAILAFSRQDIPGSRPFGGLNLAVAWWSLFSALHSLPQPVETQVFLAKIQILAFVAVPPCWLLFTSDYVRVTWIRRPRRRALLFVPPALFVIAAWTNDTHALYYTSVTRVEGVTVYGWGPIFWIAATYAYALMLAGTITMLRGLRLFPRPFRGQTISLVIAALVPWIGNAAYLSGLIRPGFDPTSVLFGVSSLFFYVGMYTLRLFDVVPTARTAVFERLTDGVFVLDRAHRVVDANAAALDIMRWTSPDPVTLEHAIGHHPSEILPWWDSLAATPAPGDAEPLLVPVGERLLELHAGTFVEARGGSLLWMRDVTARRKAEFERAALERKLREQERIESLTVMAAGLAHDFNNLLTAILGNADYLVATSPPDSERKASADAITVAAQHAADLVSQIVAFSGGGRTIISPVSVEDAVGDVLRAFTRTLGERALITHESHPGLPPLSGDLVQIRQAVLALLANAVSAVESTHGTVEVFTGRETLDAEALARMTYSAARPGDFVFVDVKDDGPGIPADVLPRIFEPFYSTHSIGRGLGLAAVHGIVRGHDGAIRITTAPGEGTSVRLWFPLG